MPPHEMRNDSPGETPEVRKDSCQQWRGILRVGPDSKKVLGPGIDGRGIPRGSRATRLGTGLS